MLKQIEGSRAVAEAVAMCRPEVICAYPIIPQTHIVEALGGLDESTAVFEARRCMSRGKCPSGVIAMKPEQS